MNGMKILTGGNRFQLELPSASSILKCIVRLWLIQVRNKNSMSYCDYINSFLTGDTRPLHIARLALMAESSGALNNRGVTSQLLAFPRSAKFTNTEALY